MNDTMNSASSPIIDALLAGCGGLTAVVSGLSALAVFTELDPRIPIALGVAGVLIGGLQAGLNNYVQRRHVQASDVLEARVGAEVIAGPANDQATPGTLVRELGQDGEPPIPQMPVEGELFLDGH